MVLFGSKMFDFTTHWEQNYASKRHLTDTALGQVFYSQTSHQQGNKK